MTSEIRRATANDVALFYGVDNTPKASLRGVVIAVDGEILGIGGVSMSIGGPVAFMNIKPEAVAHPLMIMKASRWMITNVFSLFRCPIYAFRDTSLESSGRYLKRMGFNKIDENSEVYIWRPQSHSS
jgi:hypothetical protein